jgi:FkbM family methyltransferase
MIRKARKLAKFIHRMMTGLSNGPKDVTKLVQRILLTETNRPRYFIQVGAGAGDLDPRVNFRDGFTEVIKKLQLATDDHVILIEPNPFNIDNLKECWKDFQNKEIFQIGISQKQQSGKSLPFYYSELDGPHYQVASFEPNHVLKHYRSLSIENLEVISVPSVDLKTLIDKVTRGSHIVLLALDIEGIDAEIILETDFSAINVSLLSFEYLHLGDRSEAVADHLRKCGFRYIGVGVDFKGYDHLYCKSMR